MYFNLTYSITAIYYRERTTLMIMRMYYYRQRYYWLSQPCICNPRAKFNGIGFEALLLQAKASSKNAFFAVLVRF